MARIRQSSPSYEQDEDYDLAVAIERSERDEEVETERRILNEIFESQTEHDQLLRRTSSCLPRLPCKPSVVTREQPTKTEANLSHDRLLERLEFYGMRELKVRGDGNCQFRALSEQLYRTEDFHREVRENAVAQLAKHPDWYAPYVESEEGGGRATRDFNSYRLQMARDGEWGDHVTLQAVADCYGVEIFVVSSYMMNGILEVKPRERRSQRALWVSFWAEVHYNSIYPAAEVPVSAARERWGSGVMTSVRKFADDVFFGRL